MDLWEQTENSQFNREIIGTQLFLQKAFYKQCAILEVKTTESTRTTKETTEAI